MRADFESPSCNLTQAANLFNHVYAATVMARGYRLFTRRRWTSISTPSYRSGTVLLAAKMAPEPPCSNSSPKVYPTVILL
jgi:hypothetical protein